MRQRYTAHSTHRGPRGRRRHVGSEDRNQLEPGGGMSPAIGAAVAVGTGVAVGAAVAVGASVARAGAGAGASNCSQSPVVAGSADLKTGADA